MAACPRLTELSVISPYPYQTVERKGTEFLLDPGGRAHSSMLELIVACKALQDFNTLQIVRLPMPGPLLPRCMCDRLDGRCECIYYPTIIRHRWGRLLEKHVKDLGQFGMNCLKEPKTGHSEGEGRKRITLRTIEFGDSCPTKVEEYEM